MTKTYCWNKNKHETSCHKISKNAGCRNIGQCYKALKTIVLFCTCLHKI